MRPPYSSFFGGLGELNVLAALRGTEWVGVVVLIFVLAAVWSAFRGGQGVGEARPARPTGLAALLALVVGVWSGAALHPALGALLLAIGCCLSAWGSLLLVGVTWRNHARPSIVPLLLIAFLITFGFIWPRVTITATLVILFLARKLYQKTIRDTDQQLNDLLTRLLVLLHSGAAAYLVESWFSRFSQTCSNLSLLTLAVRVQDRITVLPRAKTVAIASDSLRILKVLTSEELDRRLRTDRTASRGSSFVRVLTKAMFHELFQRLGILTLGKHVSGLMLAIPPAREQPWVAPSNAPLYPDPEGYVVETIARLPRTPNKSDLEKLRNDVEEEASRSGLEWFQALISRAEQCRQELPSVRRDPRAEMVGEVLWSIYEVHNGPRPPLYDLYDQLRVQAPDLVDGLSVRDVLIDDKMGMLQLSLNTLPTVFHELTSTRNGYRAVGGLVLETKDRRRWGFQRFEAGEDQEALFIFQRDGNS